jgi:toxin-antitoxin system PIN domain toxin
MLYLLDSNILLYSKMNGMPQHEVVAAWLVQTLSDGGNTVAVCETSVLSFLRISTNSKVFDPPLTYKEAIIFVRSLLSHRDVQFFGSSVQHFSDLTAFMQKHKFSGNLVMDAHLAVLAISTGAVLVTCDRDFKKIPYLKVLDPLAASA